MGQLIQTRKSEVKKHVATIHCSNTLSLLQRKISNALLYHAYPELLNTEEHEITVKQLCNIIGYSGNNHAVIKEALKGLISTIIEWNMIDNLTGEEDWSASAILASVRIKGSRCTYAYSPRMRELLYSPSMYGKINLIVQARFKSNYGLALYENCVRYKGLPHTRWFDLDGFRKLMGVADETYLIFRDFKKRVLDKSIEEVNTYSDMRIEPEINRAGRKVISIRFKLKDREKKTPIGVDLGQPGRAVSLDRSDYPQELVDKLRKDFGLSQIQIDTVFSAYQNEFIQQKIKLIESSNTFTAGKVSNLAAYFLSSLKEDYQAPKSSNEKLYVLKKEKEQQIAIERETEKSNEALKQRYALYIVEQYDQVINKLDEKQLEEMKLIFERILKDQNNNFILQKYKKEGFNSKICKVFFHNMIKENYPSLAPSVISLDEYTEQFNINIKNHEHKP